jgi:hypothetical protein
MKIALLVLLAATTPHVGWDMIAEWNGPGWYAELGQMPVLGPFASKHRCRAEHFEPPSTCQYFGKRVDFPKVLPPFPETPSNKQ